MYHPEWQDVEFTEATAFIESINRELKDHPFDPVTTLVRRHDLPFYADFNLFEFEDNGSEPPYTRRALVNGERAFVLNWTNGPIYAANEMAPINVTEENAPAYARFFFNFVKGRHGRFVLVDSADDIAWNGAVPEKGKEAIGKIIEPIHVVSVEDGKITMLSYMVFKDSLFRANVHVERDGMVSLSDEALVVEGMPIIEDVVNEDE